MKHFMLDIETMGTDHEADDIIEIALLECIFDSEDGIYLPGQSYSRVLHTTQKPKNDWIRTTHKDLLERCKVTPRHTAQRVRDEILAFFKSCGVVGPAFIMGLNVNSLDIPFMVAKGFFAKPYQNANNVHISDYHYRIYELKGAYNLAQDVLRFDTKTLIRMAGTAAPEVQLPPGKPHEALYDCYSQLKTLNGIIRLLR